MGRRNEVERWVLWVAVALGALLAVGLTIDNRQVVIAALAGLFGTGMAVRALRKQPRDTVPGGTPDAADAAPIPSDALTFDEQGNLLAIQPRLANLFATGTAGPHAGRVEELFLAPGGDRLREAQAHWARDPRPPHLDLDLIAAHGPTAARALRARLSRREGPHGITWILRVRGRRAEGLHEDEGERFFQLALDDLAVLQMDGRLVRANPALLAFLGDMPPEGDLTQAIHLDDAPSFLDAIDALGLGERVDDHETRFRNAAGHWRSLMWSAVADLERGQIYFAAKDVTADREAEEALRLAKQGAEEATEAKSQFLANVSHEIRTPMNGVLGLLQLLQETSLDNTQTTYVRGAQDSARNLLRILDDLLDISKVEAGAIDLEAIPFDVEDVVRDALKTVAASAQAKGLLVASRVELAQGTWVRGDPGRLRQVLVNLLGNAAKFTEQGALRVLVTQDAQAQVRFEVRDTGIGISDEQKARIFEPFQQAERSTTRRFGGTGLGLSISRELVERMGGTLDLDSRPGQGSTFHFALPLPATAPDSATPTTPFHGKRLRVEESDADECATLTRWFQALGFVVETSTTTLTHVDVVWCDHVASDPHGTGATVRYVPPGSIGSAPPHGTACLRPASRADVEDALAHALGIVSGPEEAVRRTTRALRVLLAEDNPLNQMVAEGLLGNWGHSVQVAETGTAALEAWTQGSFDLVLMDVQMPEMDGLEATRRLRQMDGGTKVPIVGVTAHAHGDDHARCLASGMDDVITKPLDAERLARLLERVASRSALDKS